ncbi:putative polyketide synthase, partial [Aureobasidium melanogenum]
MALVVSVLATFNLLEPRWRNFIRVSENPWVREHQVTNSILYPAAGMIVMAVEAMRQMAKLKPTKLRISGFELRDISIGKALVVPETNEGVETMLTMRALNTSSRDSSDLWQEFRVFSHGSSEGWTEHCRGRIAYRLESIPTVIDAGREKSVHDKELSLTHEHAQEACTSKVNVHEMYEALDAIQLSYGDTFRNITDINCGPGQSFGTIKIANVAKIMPYGFEYDYLIHPATLDSVIQTIFPALAPAGTVIENAIVPTFVEKIFISDNISNIAGHQYKTWSSANFQGFKNATADINVAESVNNMLVPLIEISGLQCSSLVEPASQDISSKVPKLCFRLDWDTDIDHLTPASIKDMFVEQAVDPSESRIISNLEEASFCYIQEAIGELTTEDVLNLDPHHTVFYEWMRSQIESVEDANFPHQTSKWLNATSEERAEAFHVARTSCCEGQMVYRMGRNLARILRKEVEPLELMLEDELLYEVYRDSLGNDRCYRQMVSYIQKLAFKNPTLNVLEIGAGTGGATLPIIEALVDPDGKHAQLTHYDFTDVSSGFFEKAQESFKAWSGLMSFKKLNIEEDPLTQGFVEGSYDLIIAANVLHATKSMKTTMENVRKLLKPNGKLVLTEITQRPLRLTMVFGNLPGWWMGAEEGRRHGPSLYDHEWDDLLKETGFSGLDICRSDYPQDADHVYSVIASSAVEKRRSELPEIFAVMPEHESSLAEHTIRQVSKICDTRIRYVHVNSIPNVTGAIVLFLAEVEGSILARLRQEDFANVQRAISISKLTFWVTIGGSVEGSRAEANVVSGLARAVRAENHALKFITLDLDSDRDSDMEAASTICRIFTTATQDINQNQGIDFEYSERSGKILIPRIFEDTPTNDFIHTDINPPVAELESFSQHGRSLKLEIGVPGLLDTLRFVDDPVMERPLASDEVDISIHATVVNFKDVMVSMGQLVEDFLGCEVSGVVTAVGSSVTHVAVGDRVCSWTLGGYGNNIRNDAGFVQKIPDDMSFEHAASLPLVYCTAYYSLFDIGHLAQGETVLIHAAAGGVGQAAIMLAKHIGAEVYVTVGTEEKKKLVQDRYGIPSDHIFSSRDTSFVSGIMSMTKGRGVDVILNSLAGEPLQQSWDCIARFGRFVEIGKRDIALNGKLNMSNFARNTTFSSVDLTVIIRHNKKLGARILKDVMSLVQQHAVQQVHPITVLGTTEIEVAFRLMQAGKHVGKVVIKSDTDCNVKVLPSVRHPLKLCADASYLLVGGLGGLGRSLGLWMSSQGARNLVFLSRTGTDREAAKACVEELRALGVHVAIYRCDVSDFNSLETAMAQCKDEMPPIRGVIHARMVLRDSIFVNMTHDDWQQALRPKVLGTQNLCKVFGTEDCSLDFFTILSSSVGVVGNFGQSNYAAGGTFQDAVARYNAYTNNLPVTTLDLGMILSVGFVAENEYAAANLKKWGFLGITQEQFLAMVKSTILRPRRSVSESQILTGLGTRGMVDDGMNARPDEDYEIPFWFYDVKFSHLLQLDRGQASAGSSEGDVNFSALLRTAETMSAASQLCVDALLEKMSKVLMMPLET